MSPVVSPARAAAPAPRLVAIDLLRGVVMVLMTVDHASESFNAGRFFRDAAWMWTPGTPIPTAQFLTRWITHLCAPTFVLLAGAALAISTEKRRARGETDRSIDGHIVARGLLLVVFEVAWMSPVMLEGFGRVLFQVLFAIGGSLVCMAALRRLPDRALLGVGLAITACSELGVGLLMKSGVARTIPAAVLLTGGRYAEGRFIVAYPLLPWLAIMCIGWSLGRRLLAWGDDASRIAPRVLAWWGVAALAIFAVVRGVDGYGNMLVHRDALDAVQWLHVSKYPPSIAFVALELGIASLVLASLFRFARSRSRRLSSFGPILLFGQVALFYYLLHIHLMHLVGWAFGILHGSGLASAWIGALATLAALYFPCRFYRGYKATHANAITRYV